MTQVAPPWRSKGELEYHHEPFQWHTWHWPFTDPNAITACPLRRYVPRGRAGIGGVIDGTEGGRRRDGCCPGPEGVPRGIEGAHSHKDGTEEASSSGIDVFLHSVQLHYLERYQSENKYQTAASRVIRSFSPVSLVHWWWTQWSYSVLKSNHNVLICWFIDCRALANPP